MTSSLSLLTQIPLPPTTDGSAVSRSITYRRSVVFPTKKWRCSVSPGQPPPPKHRQRQSKNPESGEKGIDPVGFLSKSGITHKGFALYLRERYKSLKDLKDEILTRHIDFRDMASGLV
ncbi:putative 1,4-alpha-glucan branching enzyme [Helianthus debilis subsp. tardiflorus]